MRTLLSLVLSVTVTLTLPGMAFGAFGAATQWDVRATGSDSNGGAFDSGVVSPGTDFSQQDAAQVAYTDLVIGGTTTQGTSALNPFGATSPGNFVNVTGGAGCTVQRAEVVSVSGVTATFDKSLGTGASTCTGNMGGSLLTPDTANAVVISGNTINIKAGTYTRTTTLAVSTVALITISGYGTTHGDLGTRPLITTATNSTDLISTGSTGSTEIFDNLSLSNTAGTRGNGLIQLLAHGSSAYWVVRNCKFDGFSVAFQSDNVGAHFDIANMALDNVEVANSTTLGISPNTGNIWIYGSYFHGGTVTSQITSPSGSLAVWIRRSILTDGSTSVIQSSGQLHLTESVVALSTNIGLNMASAGATQNYLVNNIFWGNNKNISASVATNPVPAFMAMSHTNAFGGAGLANANWSGSQGDITLSANPFTNSAGGDFSLNNTAGGGAALKAVGFPTSFPGGITNHLDVGPVQSQAATGGGATALVF